MHDHTGLLKKCHNFDDAATKLMGVQAKDLFILSTDLGSIHELHSRASCHHFLFTLSVKTDNFNGVDFLKILLMNSKEINYGSAFSLVLEDIKKMFIASVVFRL